MRPRSWPPSGSRRGYAASVVGVIEEQSKPMLIVEE